MTLLLKFAAAFAAIGLIVSVSGGVIGGNRTFAVVTTALLCTVLSAGLGVGVYKALEMRVPEFLRILAGEGTGDDLGGPAEGDFENAEAGEDVFGGGESGEPAMAAVQASGDTKNFGEHILVNKVKIKNEPKLMAAAIKTMLARDEE